MGSAESNRNKILFSTGTNFLSAGITVVLVALLPLRLDVTSYGYYQLFMFYNAYTPIAYLGWCEGIYLRYGGQFYQDLDKRVFNNQIRLFVIFQALVGLVLLGATLSAVASEERKFVFVCLSVSVLITNLPYFFQYLLTAVGEIEKYCLGFIVARGTILIASVAFFSLGINSYRPYVMCVLVGDALASVYYLYNCRNLLMRHLTDLRGSVVEAKENIIAGAPLLIGNTASMLVIGVMRQGVERGWSVATFGKVSLTLQASNIVLKFISAVGTVLFPLLRRMSAERQADLYRDLASLVQSFSLIMMLSYYPICVILNWWLPKYSDAIAYMGVLFPICLFEAKTSLLGYTYLKSLRKERQIMYVNLAMVAVSIMLAVAGVVYVHSLDFMIFGIVVILAVRSTVLECIASKAVGLNTTRFIVEGILVSAAFVVSNWFMQGSLSSLPYLIAMLIYLLIEGRQTMDSLRLLRDNKNP